jgi:hypothetical protein
MCFLPFFHAVEMLYMIAVRLCGDILYTLQNNIKIHTICTLAMAASIAIAMAGGVKNCTKLFKPQMMLEHET